VERFRSAKGIRELEGVVGRDIEGDCVMIFVDGDVEMRFEIGFGFVEFKFSELAIEVVDGDAVEGEEFDKTDGDDDDG